jgi:hypothetical protein
MADVAHTQKGFPSGSETNQVVDPNGAMEGRAREFRAGERCIGGSDGAFPHPNRELLPDPFRSPNWN